MGDFQRSKTCLYSSSVGVHPDFRVACFDFRKPISGGKLLPAVEFGTGGGQSGLPVLSIRARSPSFQSLWLLLRA